MRVVCRLCGYATGAKGHKQAWDRLRGHFLKEHAVEAGELLDKLDSEFVEAVRALPRDLQDSAKRRRDDEGWEYEE
jgi:hypothetical protein